MPTLSVNSFLLLHLHPNRFTLFLLPWPYQHLLLICRSPHYILFLEDRDHITFIFMSSFWTVSVHIINKMLEDYLPEEMGTCSIAGHSYFVSICPVRISFLWSVSTLIYPFYHTTSHYGGFWEAIRKLFQKCQQSEFTCLEVSGRCQKSQWIFQQSDTEIF